VKGIIEILYPAIPENSLFETNGQYGNWRRHFDKVCSFDSEFCIQGPCSVALTKSFHHVAEDKSPTRKIKSESHPAPSSKVDTSALIRVNEDLKIPAYGYSTVILSEKTPEDIEVKFPTDPRLVVLCRAIY
jgi:hypothetical protein